MIATVPATQSGGLLPGISPDIYSAADFAAVSEIAYSVAGIVLPQGKAMLVYSRLAPLVREAGCQTFANYLARVRADPAEQARTVAALTTNHTFFYREPHHFAHFAETVRPQLVDRLGKGGAVRMWSAGCSSGEETWSLVMTLLGDNAGEGARLARSDVRMLASDIAPHALKRAAAASYTEREMEAVPEALRKCWTRSVGGVATISDAARELVRFRTLNLQGDWPMNRAFDVIFCRNVMIYFDNPTKERLLARFAEAIVPGGFLYIGHSERVTGAAARVLRPVGPTIYQKGGQ